MYICGPYIYMCVYKDMWMVPRFIASLDGPSQAELGADQPGPRAWIRPSQALKHNCGTTHPA